MENDPEICKVALLSSTQFGQRCLQKGILPTNGIELVGIVTTTSTVNYGNNKDTLEIASPSDFSSISNNFGCELVTIEGKPSADDYLAAFDRWKPDLVLVLGWYHLLSASVLTMPPLGTVAIHASMLPRYRGMAPISWAIINGEKKTGVTLFYLDTTVDGGDIIAQSPIMITGKDDCATLYTKVTDRSIELLRQYLPLLANQTAPRKMQDNSGATKFPRRRPKDGLIDWNKSADDIYNFIRAQTRPYPGAFTWVQGQKIMIWRGMAVDSVGENSLPGQILSRDDHSEIVTANGSIRLLDFEIEGASSGERKKCRLIPGDVCRMSPDENITGSEKEIVSQPVYANESSCKESGI